MTDTIAMRNLRIEISADLGFTFVCTNRNTL